MKYYNKKIYLEQRNGSHRSAKQIMRFVLRLVSSKSAIDVKCEISAWLKATSEFCTSDFIGLDGLYVKKNLYHRILTPK